MMTSMNWSTVAGGGDVSRRLFVYTEGGDRNWCLGDRRAKRAMLIRTVFVTNQNFGVQNAVVF